jgi:hypothetical protein
VPDANPNQDLIDARTTLRDTAKWIVTIVGTTIVLVIGGGLIAKIADLDWAPRLIAAGSLLVLTMACLIPLRAAIDIVAARLVPFGTIVRSGEYEQARQFVNGLIRDQFPPDINTVQKVGEEYSRQTAIANNPNSTDAARGDAVEALDELEPRITAIIEISNTELLRLKFNSLVRSTTFVLPLIGASLFVFLVSTHRDDQTEKQLAKPILMQIPWNATVEAVLKKAGLDAKCYATAPPKLLQLSEKSGLRAGVLVIPKDLSVDCPAVRVIVTNSDDVYPDN